MGRERAVKTALVIGGGIAGPVVAAALRRAGVGVTVFEAYAEAADGVGGMLMVAPNGLDAFAAVGVGERVADLGQPCGSMVMEDFQGRKVFAFGGLPGLPASRLMWRSDLYRVLRDRAVELGAVVEHGKRLVGVEEGPDSITAVFDDGTTATGDVLVGADGIRSTVRTLIDPDAPGPEPVGLLGLGGWGPPVPGIGGPDVMHLAQGKRAFFGYWATPEGDTAWFSNLPHKGAMSTAEARAVPTEDWLRHLRTAHEGDHPAERVLAGARDLQVIGALEILPDVEHWYRGRMVLVGDAAHAPSPSSGQGVSITAESAVQLARCLRDIADLPGAFAAYERLRRARVNKIIAGARRTNNSKAAGPVARAVGRVLAPVLSRTVFTPRRIFGDVHAHTIDWEARVTA
ncbi:2-polyprenyl-6-methoxyphenol hydroxylase-like FAD-dependent oxidoreductase [Actinokineospora baliensis]|uniref:FAD-dependent oxidoreductase n=1 Tax=Actinokineospora baliensis TaxID=547056 RepID=UPI0019574C5B|nr:FAD-dependent monooxygenase [Actinokineospora baliensis]MBM7775394.1 2-polyprenyl-6-methoxyphenol hydroxylase-like FAD-dependent oxidoreductase [Actinokineospora baliensis]